MSNGKAQMSNQAQNPRGTKKYDLEERTAQFGETIVELVKTFPKDPVNKFTHQSNSKSRHQCWSKLCGSGWSRIQEEADLAFNHLDLNCTLDFDIWIYADFLRMRESVGIRV
jgi:hypothetical protein